MRWPKHGAAKRGDDRGASLLLAVLFLSLASLVIPAVLGLCSASLFAFDPAQKGSQADGDATAALQTAVTIIKDSAYDNQDANCFRTGSDYLLPDPLSAGNYRWRATCAAKDGTGASGVGVPISSSNKPAWALLTLGTDPNEPGIGQTGNSVLRVRGKVNSNSTISVGGKACSADPQPPTDTNCAELYQVNTSSQARVTAAGSCDPPVYNVVPNAVACGTGTLVADPGDSDPTTQPGKAYQPPSSSSAAVRTVPSCSSGTSSAVTLQAGIYRDAAALNALMTCTSRVILFTPGTYFFDFRNGEPGQPAGNHVWTVGSAATQVIGGTPLGWDAAKGTKPTFTTPGNCVSPLSTTSAASGVQFVFGGDSRLQVTAGWVELCGQWAADHPPITVFGAKRDIGAGSGTGVPDPTKSTSVTTPAFAPLSGLAKADSVPATATFAGSNKAATATLTAKGFLPASAPPAGSMLQSAVLTIRHRTRTFALTPSYTITPPVGGTAVTGSMDGGTLGTWIDKTVDLRAALAAPVNTGTFTELQVDLSVLAGKNVSAGFDVDAVSLALSWVPPDGIRGETSAVAGAVNCVGTAPYIPNSSQCALLTTSGNQTSLYVTGTTYAPAAALDIGLTNAGDEVFRSGLIARSLRISLSSSVKTTQPIIDVPDDSTTSLPDLTAYLHAYRCATGSSCPAAGPWVEVGRAVVTFGDGGSYPPVPGERTVHVDAWRVLRCDPATPGPVCSDT